MISMLRWHLWNSDAWSIAMQKIPASAPSAMI
jgi:hypothetical protein